MDEPLLADEPVEIRVDVWIRCRLDDKCRYFGVADALDRVFMGGEPALMMGQWLDDPADPVPNAVVRIERHTAEIVNLFDSARLIQRSAPSQAFAQRMAAVWKTFANERLRNKSTVLHISCGSEASRFFYTLFDALTWLDEANGRSLFLYRADRPYSPSAPDVVLAKADSQLHVRWHS